MNTLERFFFKLLLFFVHSPAKEACAEFFGTLVLVLLGDGIMATVTLGHLGAHGVIVSAIGWGVSVTIAVALAGTISGGHVNPAVTIALATMRKCPWKYVVHYLVAQYLGGFIAAAFVYIVYYDAINEFDNGHRQLPPHPNSTAQIFSTYPQDFVSIGSCFLDQVIGTAMLLIVICTAIDQRYKKVPSHYQPTIVGLGLMAIILAFGYNCGAPLNPARDLGPRIFTLLAGWGTETFSFRNHMWFWVPVLGPHVGALLGVLFYSFFIDLTFANYTMMSSEAEEDEKLVQSSEHEDQNISTEVCVEDPSLQINIGAN
ncbi:aquaporin-10-like [Argiope bruennichi]|uniref:aquaporin-10-like n=1 Tax=Argiope bruennichi TaxID=94029 RepID=UPI00249478F6|nr:aquaporin-10-like [Argiope bruennichi]